MAAPDESNAQLRQETPDRPSGTTVDGRAGVPHHETAQPEHLPFTDEDPHRSVRFATLRSEDAAFLAATGYQATGYDKLSPKLLHRVSENAFRRTTWDQTRQDDFNAILRLGRKTPGRGQRIL